MEMDLEINRVGDIFMWYKSWNVVAKASNGLLHGPAYIIYDRTGDTLFQLNYANGLLHGTCFEYNEIGDTIGSVIYQNGLKEGREWNVSKTGIYDVTHYENGLVNGVFYSRAKNGSYLIYGNAVNGQNDGVLFSQYDTGGLKYTLLYKNGKVVNGDYYLFDAIDGQPIERITFLNGEVVQRISYLVKDE